MFYKDNFLRVNWNSLQAEMTDKKTNPTEEKIIKPLRKKQLQNSEEDSQELAKRSSIFDRYPEAFVEAVRGTPIPVPDEKGSFLADHYAAFTGIGLSAMLGFGTDFEYGFLPAAGQMRLTAIQKAQLKRQRERLMEELNSVLERIRLTMDEFHTAEAELEVTESSDPEYEAEEKERKEQEQKMEKRKRIARRKKRPESQQVEEMEEHEEKEVLSDSEEDSGGSSDEYEDDDDVDDEDDDGKNDEDSNGQKMPGQAKRKVSKKMLVRRAKRRRVLKGIASYLELCIEREDIMRQMQSWMESTADEELSKPTRTYMFSPELLLEDLPSGIASEMHGLGKALVRLKVIADSLGIGESKLEEDLPDEGTERQQAKPRGPRTKIIYNVEELDNEDNWNQAEAGVVKTLEQATKVIPVRKIRLNVDHTKKQFLLMAQVMAKRNQVIHELDSQAIDLEGELVKAKRQNEELRKNNKKTKVKAEKFQYQCEDLQTKLSEQQKIISELNEKLDQYKRKESYGLYKSSSESIGSLRESGESVSVISLVEKPSQQLAPTGEKFIIKTPKSSKVQVVVASDASNATTQEAKQPSPTTNLNSEEANKKIEKLKESLQRVEDELKIEKEKSAAFEVEFTSLQSDKVRVEQERSELEIQLEDVKRENERAMEELTQKLEDAERENKRLTGEIECNEEMIKYQEERLGQFMEEIQCLEERMMSFPPTPATMSVASMAGAPRRERRKTSLQLGLEPQTARQMMAKVKQQYESELQSLKDHMAKENQRHQAEIRRYEHDHKKDVQNIHKEALLLLRALNRFKDCVATLLDREHLGQEAHAIRSHAPLPLDENFGDTRQMLARMAILSNEMLISVELHLSRALMSKRLELKDTNLGKMEYQTDPALGRKMKDYGSMQTGKMKGTHEEFQGQQLEFLVWRLLEEGRRQDVMEKFRELLSQIATHEKQLESAKKTGEESVKKKDAQMKRVLRREAEVKRTVGEQKTIIKNLASIWKSRRIGQKYIRRKDQQRNLQLLEEAMKANEISQELYESTTKLIKEAMDFPRKRFIEMVKKYVHFRRVKEIQENVQRMKMETNVNERVLLSLKEMEERMVKQKELWGQKKEQFIKARADILEQLYRVLTQVHEETGILLTKPIDLIPRLDEIKEDVKEINEADIREAANIPKERAKLRKAQLQAQAAVKEKPLSPVDGTGVTREANQGTTWKVMSTFPPAMVTTPKLLDLDINRNRLAAQDILARLSHGSLDAKSVSLPPSSFFPSLYGYYKKPDDGIRKTRSEVAPKRKNIVKTFRSKVRFLPPIATLYPEDEQEGTS